MLPERRAPAATEATEATPPEKTVTAAEPAVARPRGWAEPWRGRPWSGALAAAVVLVLAGIFPLIFNDYLTGVATTILMLAILAGAWNLIGGFAGYPSFGNAVFWGLGAYGTAVTMVKLHAPFAAGFVAGGLVSALLALIIGVPVLRLRGHYFAIATLGVLSVVQQIVTNADAVTGGGAGLSLPLPSLNVQAFDQLVYWIMLAIVAVLAGFTFWMSRSRLGYGLIAIRENEVAARVMGVNTTRYKVIAFMLSGLFSGFAGATYAYWRSSIDPGVAFDLQNNVLLVIAAFFGGAGTVLGPLVGAAILGVLSEWLRNALVEYHLLVFGVVLVLTVTFAPNGMMEYLGGRRGLSLASLLENIRANRV